MSTKGRADSPSAGPEGGPGLRSRSGGVKGLRHARIEPYGTIHYPRGSLNRTNALFDEVGEYFEHGIELRPGAIVFDVGANIGAFSLLAGHRLGGEIRLYCFEPAPPLFAALEENLRHPLLARGFHRAFAVALTGHPRIEDEVEFYFFRTIPADSTYDLAQKRTEFEAFFGAQGDHAERHLGRLGWVGREVGAWVKTGVAAIPRGGLTRWLMDRALGLERYRCPLLTVDEVVAREKIERIDLLKVDVEGAELDVLRGIGPATWPKILQLALEGHDIDGRRESVEALVRGQGFAHVEVARPALAKERGLTSNFLLSARR